MPLARLPRVVRASLLLLFVIVLLALWFRPFGGEPRVAKNDSDSGASSAAATRVRVPAHDSARPAIVPVAPSPEWPRSPLADGLDNPSRSARDDLGDLAQVLLRYRETHRTYPAFADNAQLVNALSGANPARAPYLPRDLAVIDQATGILNDRWGTPYFFHALGSDALEIRSAGPDRELYTPDDLLHRLGPPPLVAQPEVQDSAAPADVGFGELSVP